MSDLSKDILIAMLFLTGLVGFISGEFIISSTLFGINFKSHGKHEGS
jgi:hypothetical protein